MRRREFIRLISGAAAAWPFTVCAQQGDRMRRIGVLTGTRTRAEDAENKDRDAAFEQALQQLGWMPGRNVRIDYRFSGGDAATSRKQAEELVALAPDVIVSTGSFSTGNLLRVTHTVPVVFAIVPDPVGSGFVDSLSQPNLCRAASATIKSRRTVDNALAVTINPPFGVRAKSVIARSTSPASLRLNGLRSTPAGVATD
jgi:ABC-type uncharacterized transport system substrate-binding protein